MWQGWFLAKSLKKGSKMGRYAFNEEYQIAVEFDDKDGRRVVKEVDSYAKGRSLFNRKLKQNANPKIRKVKSNA